MSVRVCAYVTDGGLCSPLAQLCEIGTAEALSLLRHEIQRDVTGHRGLSGQTKKKEKKKESMTSRHQHTHIQTDRQPGQRMVRLTDLSVASSMPSRAGRSGSGM